MIYFIIFFSVFIFTLGTVGFVFFMKRSSDADNQENINKAAIDKINESDFVMTRIVHITDYATYNKDDDAKMFFAIDSENQKVAFVNYENGKVSIVRFDEILNYEVYENNTLETSGALIGGFVGLMGAETSGTCKELRLIVRFKDLNYSQINYDVISTSLGIVKTSGVYRKCIKSLQEAVSVLEAIINKSKEQK